MILGWMEIIEDIHMTKAGTPYEERRGWMERLFGRGAWRPHGDRPTRTIVPQVPSDKVFQIGARVLVMHPAKARQMREPLQREQEAHERRWR